MNANHYIGGKSADGKYHQIINLMPPHSTYIELFGGKLGIYRHKKPAHRTFVIEQDESLADYYRSLGFTELLTPTEFNKYLHKPSKFKGFLIWDTLDYLDTYSYALDYADFFVYVDPPYPMNSRKSPRKVYRYELTDEQHTTLVKELIPITMASIAISTYPNEIYNNEFLGRDDWSFCEFAAQTRHGRATEQLWMNYPAPDQLHDYRYLGRNFREREDITRKQCRWLANFNNLPILERRAMLEILTAAIPKTADELHRERLTKKGISTTIYV